jgi:hypothetical protein
MKMDDYAKIMNADVAHIQGFDHCIIGITAEAPFIAVYSTQRVVKEIAKRTGLPLLDAESFFEAEILGSVPDMGVPKPIFLDEVNFEV